MTVYLWSDPVTWTISEHCNRCGGTADHYITPYFAPARQVCPRCASELAALFHRCGWPPTDTRYDPVKVP